MNEDTKKALEALDEPGSTSGAPGLEPGAAPVAAKRGGRPKGAKNRPRAGVSIRHRRKGAKDLKDTKSGIKGLCGDLKVVADKHNAEHGTAIRVPSAEEVLATSDPRVPVVSPAQCGFVLAIIVEGVGAGLAVDVRPDQAAVEACAAEWSKASAYLPQVDPVWVVVGGAIVSTALLIAPMVVAHYRPEPVASVVPLSEVKA